MGRRPLDRRLFRDSCAAERSQMWLPESMPQDIHWGELIVRRLAYYFVAWMTMYIAFVYDEARFRFEYLLSFVKSLPVLPFR